MNQHLTGQTVKQPINPKIYNNNSSAINDLVFRLKILEIDPEELRNNAAVEEDLFLKKLASDGYLRGERIA